MTRRDKKGSVTGVGRSVARAAAVIGVTGLTIVAMGVPASAHTSTNPSKLPADSYAATNFRVPGGCEGSPTTKVTMQVPRLSSVSTQPVPGWKTSVKKGRFKKPIQTEDTTVRKGVQQITWTATSGSGIPEGQFRDFKVSMKLPDKKPGTVLWFPTLQQCKNGEFAHKQTQIPNTLAGRENLDQPAPYIMLTAPEQEPAAAKQAVVQQAAATSPAGGGGGGPGPLAIVGVVLGALGILLGGTGIALSRRGTTST